jgi:anti-anti-sigma regulatory factor
MQSLQYLCLKMTFLRVESAPPAETTPRLREAMSRLLNAPGDVVLDLRGVNLDTTGLSSILGMQHHLSRLGRRLVVVANDPGFMALVERAGAHNAFTLFADAEEAVQFCTSGPACTAA